MMTKEKLHQSEGEVRTLKSFLVSKTALMEKKSREIKGTYSTQYLYVYIIHLRILTLTCT